MLDRGRGLGDEQGARCDERGQEAERGRGELGRGIGLKVIENIVPIFI